MKHKETTLKEFDEHCEEHGCGDPDSTNFKGGTAYCPIAQDILKRMNKKDRELYSSLLVI